MNEIITKLKNKNLLSSDIDYIISKIEFILKNKKNGYQNLSEDDIENLKIIKDLFKNFELKQRNIRFNSNSSNYAKVKIILNELSLNQIISEPIWFLGGGCDFEIIDLTRFRNYMYKLIELIIGKFSKSEFLDKVKKDELKSILMNPWTIVVIGGLIVLILWALLNPVFFANLKSNDSTTNYINRSNETGNEKSPIILEARLVNEGESVLIFSNQVRLDFEHIDGFTKSVWINIFFSDNETKRVDINGYERGKFEYKNDEYFIDALSYRGNMAEITITKKIS